MFMKRAVVFHLDDTARHELRELRRCLRPLCVCVCCLRSQVFRQRRLRDGSRQKFVRRRYDAGQQPITVQTLDVICHARR